MNKPQLITCTGYGGTGSSVISDLLKEYDSVVSMGDFEFSLAHEVDGISDLEHYYTEDFNRLKTTEAIYRFKKLIKSIRKHYSPFFNNKFDQIIEDYLKNITQVKWKGFWHQHVRRTSLVPRYLTYIIPNILWNYARKLKPNDGYEPPAKMRKQEMALGYGETIFLGATRNLFDQLTQELNRNHDADYIVMDQLVPPYSTNRYSRYFSNLKIIIIDRDPRDLYLLNKLFWKEGWIPSDDVDIYIKWFKLIREHQKRETDSDNVLKLKFEDCIFKYEETVSIIESFLGLSKQAHNNPKKYFNPDYSKRNVQLWKKYNSHNDDVRKIAENLKEYCYEVK